MKVNHSIQMMGCLLLVVSALLFSLSSCGNPDNGQPLSDEPDLSRFLVVVEDEPDTVDFQSTTIFYTIATNVFDRLVEMRSSDSNEPVVVPSLAESWEVSEDGCSYTFHLRKNINFSNGAPLTASDVLYSFSRLLTYENSCNQDIARVIKGADLFEQGKTDQLEGFEILNDQDFVITLEQPYEAFLSCLSMPGASIMDEETTKNAEELFGNDPAYTIGTGPFILWKWDPGVGMLLKANPDCWSGAPNCEGLDLRFITESEALQIMFETGELDILDLDDVGEDSVYYQRGDIYQDRLVVAQQIGITYIALNESYAPLSDVRVRKALQLGLNRKVLLDAVYLGYGFVENGIFPRGLYGYNPDLETIPYDPNQAKELLEEAGYPDGFDLTVSVKDSSSQSELTQMKLAASMWKKIGVRASVEVIEEDQFMSLRKKGGLECYTATWTADFNDPDNFIYTFFGNRENTVNRSLCYSNEAVMRRVKQAQMITDKTARLQEYWELEKIIVQRDAAWIPLFSRQRLYVTSDRIEGVRPDWNGSVKNRYREITIKRDKTTGTDQQSETEG